MPLVRPTMKTVAAQAGVSIMTVSRSLRNQPCIPESTRLRIQKIAVELGYRPNPMIATLMAELRGRRQHKDIPSLRFVTAYPDPEHWKDLLFNVNAFRGARARADELGYKLEHFCMSEPGMTFQRASRILRNQGIAGLLIAPLPVPAPVMDIKWEWFCCVDVGASLKYPVHHRAMADHYSLMRLAYVSLRELGYRRIGLALRPNDDEVVDNKWVGAFRTEQYFANPSQRVPIFREQDWRPEPFLRWFEKNRPDVVISTQPEVENWLQNAGYDVPGDVGVALPDLSANAHNPALSGIDQRTEILGAIAVDLVVEQIMHNERGIPKIPKAVLVQGEWVPGKTVRPQDDRLQPRKRLTAPQLEQEIAG